MSARKLWYLVTIIAFAIMPLAGCSGSNTTAKTTPKGVQLTVDGKVDSKTTAKTTALAAGDANSVTVYNAQDGTALGTAEIVNGKFSGLTFTLPEAKAVLVFKATVAQGVFRSIVPLDLSNPPTTAITGSNPIVIAISQQTTDVATAVSAMLGINGLLGDTGATLASVNKTYTDAATQVANNGGQLLAYNNSGLALTGSVTSVSMLPATDASTFSYSDLNDITPVVKINSAFVPGKNPIVNFQVTNKATGKGISGLKTFGLHVAKLMPELNGESSYWVNYIDKGIAVPAGSGTGATAASKPSADPGTTYNTDGSVKVKGYSVIDHGDGSYTAIFASDVTSNTNADGIHNYDANLIHRIGVTVTTIAVPGVTATAPKSPTGVVTATFAAINRAAEVFDFVPATGVAEVAFARDIVSKSACETCHSTDLPLMSGHFARWNPRLCVICHTSTNTSGEGEFVTLIHRAHVGKNLPLPLVKGLVDYPNMSIPQDVRNCVVCHKGTDVDNWKTKASKKNCGSCHNNISFDATVPTGMTAHSGGAMTDNKFCAGCHVGATASAEVSAKHVLPASVDASQRPLNPTIKSATVDATTGKLTITFTVDNNGTAVTDPAAFALPSFVLAKLVPAANGNSSYWQSMINQFRTKDGAKKPVLQGTSEAATAGTVLYDATKSAFVYTFALPYSVTPGDFTSGFAKAPIKRSNAPYVNDTMLDLPFTISYDATATYRVGMQFTNNKNNATFDFVPDGVTAKQSRKIVSMAACQKCHAGSTLHGRYNVDLCVVCHSLYSFDPYTGDPNGGINDGTTTPVTSTNLRSVNIENIVHKIHMGKNLPSVLAGTSFMINGEDFGKTVYPASVKNCATCHVEGTGAPVNAANWYTMPTKEACMGCHDGAATKASHGGYDNQACVSCHGSNRAANAKSAHRWW